MSAIPADPRTRLLDEIAALRRALDALADLPDVAAPLRRQLAAKEAELHALPPAPPPAPPPRRHDQAIDGKAQLGAAVAGDVGGSINAPQFPPGVAGVGMAHSLTQHFYSAGPPPPPPPAATAAEISQVRREALLAYHRGDWATAADLLARLVERDADDQAAQALLNDARAHLRLQDRYEVARALRTAGEWQAVLSTLDELASVQPAFPDRDGLRAWAEGERVRATYQPRFGPVYQQVAAGQYAAALTALTNHLQAAPTDTTALQAAAALIEDGALPVPARVRVACGEVLARCGDPRPGVCDLPPPFVAFAGGSFVLGEPKGQAAYDDEVNDQPLRLAAVELARYPVTNAQFQQFINAGGYDPAMSWWSDAARRWLRQKEVTRPRDWDNPRFGIARPNHPVIGISWYEAMAFCAWLTTHLNDGYGYILLSEAEWEYAARGVARRTYAWGNEPPDAERANFDQTYAGTTAVGCFPTGATPEGLFDITGTVWEWTRSAFRPYPYDPQHGREDPTDPAQKRFTLRGGSWVGHPLYLRAAFRGHLNPDNRDVTLGFRLARRLPRVKD